MHHDTLHINTVSAFFANFDCEDEATGREVGYLLFHIFILNRLNFQVFVHEEDFELFLCFDPNDAFAHVGDDVQNAVLADPENALSVRAELRNVPVKKGHAHVDYVQVVCCGVSVEEP